MQVWIRGMRDYKHKVKLAATVWELPIWSDSAKDTGTVTVVGEVKDLAGEWAILNGWPCVVKSCAPAKGSTQLVLQLPETAFDRELRYSGSGTEAYGTFLASAIVTEFIGQADPVYAMPYLTVSNSDTTGFVFPVADGEIYTLLDVIESAKTAGVYLTWTAAYDGVAVAIARREAEEHTLLFDDGHTQLVSQTYTGKIVAKVDVRQIRTEDDDTITVLDESTWYWQPDGSVSETPPAPRIPGTWVHVDVDEETPMIVGAVEAMADNSSAYKLEFWSDRDYDLGTTLTCRIGSIVSQAELTYARRSSGDRRTYYRAGRAVLTLTDILRAQESGATRSTSRRGGGGGSDLLANHPVGNIYASTDATSPAQLFGGAWERITGRFLFGTDTTENDPGTYPAGSTGGEAAHTLTTDEMAPHTHDEVSLTGTFTSRRAGTNGSVNMLGGGSGIVSRTDKGGGSAWGTQAQTVSSSCKPDVISINASHEHASVGGGQAHNNMPPYLAVYVWRRIA